MVRCSIIVIKFVAVFSFAISSFGAPCPSPQFTEPGDVFLEGESVLIVTHPSTQWDGRFSSKAGMDSAVQYAKKRGFPVIYLQDPHVDITAKTYFLADCYPDYYVSSGGGEFSFSVPTTHVYSVGGHWEQCQKNTINNLINAWKEKSGNNFKITMVMDGIYTLGAYVNQSDPYHDDLHRFLGIVRYRNPRDPGSAYGVITKLNLLEMMGIINDDKLQREYLKRNLPHYGAMPAEYEIKFTVNNITEILRAGSTPNAPILEVEYVNSLYEEGYIPASPSFE